MDFGFLFWIFLGGILIAIVQDLKRREIDNWLVYLLFVSGLFYHLFFILQNGDYFSLIYLVVFCLLCYGVSLLMYNSRIFAGGDAMLLFSLSVFFFAGNLYGSLINLSLFILFLLVGGSIYGLIYSFFLWGRNFRLANRKMKSLLFKMKLKYYIVVSLVLALFSFFEIGFLILAFTVLLFPFLWAFAKGLESEILTKTIKGKDLREGDWLVSDVRLKNQLIKKSWDGLTEKDIKLLKNKEVKIVDGIPYAPAFLIALFVFVLFKDSFLSFLYSLF